MADVGTVVWSVGGSLTSSRDVRPLGVAKKGEEVGGLAHHHDQRQAVLNLLTIPIWSTDD